MNYFSSLLGSVINVKLIIVYLSVLVVIFMIVTIFQFFLGKNRKSQLQQTAFVLQQFQPAAGLENFLHLLLEEIRKILEAPVSAFYIYDKKSDHFVLKAVRKQKTTAGGVEPSYSGLVPFTKEEYQPPLGLPKNSFPEQLMIVKDGDVPLLTIPVSGGIGMVRLGPIFRISGSQRAKLGYLFRMIQQLLTVLIEEEQLKEQTMLMSTSVNALRNLSVMALNTEALIQKIFRMAVSSLSLTGGFVLIKKQNHLFIQDTFQVGLQVERKLRENKQQLQQIWELTNSIEPIRIRLQDVSNGKQLSWLISSNTEEWIFTKIHGTDVQAILAFQRQDQREDGLISQQSLQAIQSMVQNAIFMIQNQLQLQTGIMPYISLMKRLAQTIDNVNPYTVGYSEMMSRFSIIIAKELRLPSKEIEAIVLAAYLSNIGVIGLSEDLYLKEGKYREEEYEIMKLHVEVGANIVEMMTGNKIVADLIKFHHERMDGNGYPFGLVGEQIPIGSRIISVVQTFLAKINGRKYRGSLSFDKALSLLQSSAGTQLDANVVHVFVNWFHGKRSDKSVANRALGACWDMCCVPKEICIKCPAFQQTTKNCWDFPHNNCQAHGKSCETCFVKTELATRFENSAKKTTH